MEFIYLALFEGEYEKGYFAGAFLNEEDAEEAVRNHSAYEAKDPYLFQVVRKVPIGTTYNIGEYIPDEDEKLIIG